MPRDKRDLTVEEVNKALDEADRDSRVVNDGDYYRRVEQSLNVRRGTVTAFMCERDPWELFD